MADVLDDVVSTEYLQTFEKSYNEQLRRENSVDAKTQFEYAWCLVRSKYPADIRKAIVLLENLLKQSLSGERPTEDGTNTQRDYLYYLAVGYAKLKEYSNALKFIRSLLQLEPGNRQACELERLIKKRMEIDGLKGMAIAGGAVLALGSLVGLGVALAKK